MVTKWTLIRIFTVEMINVDFDTYFHDQNDMLSLICKFTREIEHGILVKKLPFSIINDRRTASMEPV